MPVSLPDALDRLTSLALDDERLIRVVAAGRRKGQERPRSRRAELRYVDLVAGRHLQITEYDETQAFTRNVPAGGPAGQAIAELVREPFGNWHLDAVDQTLQVRVTKKGKAQVHVAPVAGTTGETRTAPDRRHNRVKARLIPPDEPFLRALGITDGDGRIKPSRRDKYHQIEEFVRQLQAALDDSALRSTAAEGTGPDDRSRLQVVDLGCGNAYLTFAAYAYLTRSRGLPVRLVGVDVRRPARERNTRIAAELGWSEHLTFVESEIGTALVQAPDVVLALHACDTATDDALARGVRERARLLLAAPCCHHDLQTQLRGTRSPEAYGLVTRHGILRERLADMLTDALRAAVLRIAGYRVDVVEFVDSAHTPRNLLIRAVRTGAAATSGTLQDYHALTSTWGVRPALARLLAADLPELAEARQ